MGRRHVGLLRRHDPRDVSVHRRHHPEKLQRLPDLRGLKDEVIIPRHSRNVYDHAIRMLGVRILEPATREEYEAALSPTTAIVYVNSSNRNGVEFDTLTSIARDRGVPVLVDAAAERLTVPNDYLRRGATMVCYSGGKLFRGPQCSESSSDRSIACAQPGTTARRITPSGAR